MRKHFTAPASGNGGYVGGRLASFIDGPAAVRLKAPPPLERPLTVKNDGAAVRLVDLGRKGRIHYVATALFDSRGRCCAMARASWVEVTTMPA